MYGTPHLSPSHHQVPWSQQMQGGLGRLDVLHTKGLVVLGAVLHLLRLLTLLTSFTKCWENAPSGHEMETLQLLQYVTTVKIPTYPRT